ncbi:MAG TPA: CoA transferase, partial [Syntrophorhabdaceae bacterium]|nr:CoA transferase [Syntrophorhabdaceae bacterium]
PERRGKTPYLGVWQTKDGKYICTTDLEHQYWERFCRTIGKEEFIPFQHDPEKKETMIEAIGKIMLSRNRDEWVLILTNAGSQVAPVYDPDEALRDPQVIHRQMVLEIEDAPLGKTVKQIGIPIKLSETPGRIRHVAALPGEHTRQTMERLGYSENEIQRLEREGIIHFQYKTEKP